MGVGKLSTIPRTMDPTNKPPERQPSCFLLGPAPLQARDELSRRRKRWQSLSMQRGLPFWSQALMARAAFRQRAPIEVVHTNPEKQHDPKAHAKKSAKSWIKGRASVNGWFSIRYSFSAGLSFGQLRRVARRRVVGRREHCFFFLFLLQLWPMKQAITMPANRPHRPNKRVGMTKHTAAPITPWMWRSVAQSV